MSDEYLNELVKEFKDYLYNSTMQRANLRMVDKAYSLLEDIESQYNNGELELTLYDKRGKGENIIILIDENVKKLMDYVIQELERDDLI